MTEFSNSIELVSPCSAGVPPARKAGRMPAYLLGIWFKKCRRERPARAAVARSVTFPKKTAQSGA